jgi:hypothetical protein
MQFILHPVRLATIHPLLAHLTLGGTVMFIIAYAIGAQRKSSAWTFTGDATLYVTTAFTVATFVFGLVSNVVVPWPGGIELWRAVHLWVALAATVALVLLSTMRLRQRRRSDAPPSLVTALGILAAAGAIGLVGWIGGEVLVYHSGMAVRAAGDGAFAPPVTSRREASNFLDAMREARGAWGGITAELGWMLVQHPTDEGWERIATDAERMQLFATIMAKEPDMNDRSQEMADEARRIAIAARGHKLSEIARVVGEAGATCAGCHEEERWH